VLIGRVDAACALKRAIVSNGFAVVAVEIKSNIDFTGKRHRALFMCMLAETGHSTVKNESIQRLSGMGCADTSAKASGTNPDNLRSPETSSPRGTAHGSIIGICSRGFGVLILSITAKIHAPM
jgi:hypothetical protein